MLAQGGGSFGRARERDQVQAIQSVKQAFGATANDADASFGQDAGFDDILDHFVSQPSRCSGGLDHNRYSGK